MKIIYLCSYNLDEHKSHYRATNQKLSELKTQVDELKIISLKWKFFKIFELLFLDLRASYLILKTKPSVLISRGFVGLISQYVAKNTGTLSAREIHADIFGEIDQYGKNWLVKKLLYCFAHYSLIIDNSCDVRIFNHPNLLEWYNKEVKKKQNDIAVYNGFDFESKSLLSKNEARKYFKFDKEKIYIVFVGSAKYWHGVCYLSKLQQELNNLGQNIQIVCGGGKVSKSDDPNKNIINISPLNSIKCSDLIMASDACILPVRNSRVSPGSALKLYDYILHNKFVITQENLKGYSDELEKYNNGILVNFSDPKQTAIKIINAKSFFSNTPSVDLSIFSWKARIREWVKCFNELKKI